MTEENDKSICEGREECADCCLLSCKGMHGKRERLAGIVLKTKIGMGVGLDLRNVLCVLPQKIKAPGANTRS